MTKHQLKIARHWMNTWVEAYRDECGEINCTKMAEACAYEYDLYVGDNYDIPEELFDLAVLVDEWQRR